MIKFWKKYKAKKELKNKLKKARFINFYEYSIDLEDGKPISFQRYNEYSDNITEAYIFLYYSNSGNLGRDNLVLALSAKTRYLESSLIIA